VKWGEATVTAWNSAHPNEQVTGQEIPAGRSSEEVIGAAITAGNTPCLIYNTAPAAVPQFQKQGGLVDLSTFPDGASYIEARTGKAASQHASADRRRPLARSTRPSNSQRCRAAP
jgi:multiple sugar transport system substrate-binding protein